MIRKITYLLCVAALSVAFVGCNEQSKADDADPTRNSVSGPKEQSNVAAPDTLQYRTPMTLQISGPEQPKPGDTIDLTVSVTRQFLVPFDLTITLPEGVRLVKGQLKERIDDGKSRVITRKLTVAMDGDPTGDVLAQLDSRGDGYGVHSKAEYRFGRKPVGVMQMQPRVRRIVADGKDLGNSIEIGN